MLKVWTCLLLVLVLLFLHIHHSFGRTTTTTATTTTRAKQHKGKKCTENDHYCVLEVSPTASEEEIKKQYRKLAKIYHPDKNRDDPQMAEAQFVRISKAYETLSDAKSRREYDDERRYGGRSSQQQHQSFHQEDDIFNTFRSMFGEEFPHAQYQQHNRGGFNSRHQQQYQQYQQQQHHQQQRYRQQQPQQQTYNSKQPNQKMYFTQRGPDGRTYYYEFNGHQQQTHHQQFHGEEEAFDPFAYLFDAQYRNRGAGKSYVWYYDFFPTSPFALFFWQVGYYLVFLYIMLSIFSCCMGLITPAAAANRNNTLQEDDDDDDERKTRQRQLREQQEKLRQSQKQNVDTKSNANKGKGASTNHALYPLPVITRKEIVETRGIIFVVASSAQMEILLRSRRKSFAQDPVLFRRYHLAKSIQQPPKDDINDNNSSNNRSNNINKNSNRYEEVKMMEQLFQLYSQNSNQISNSSNSTKDFNALFDEQRNQLMIDFRVVAVAKTGGKYAIFTPSESMLRRILQLRLRAKNEPTTGGNVVDEDGNQETDKQESAADNTKIPETPQEENHEIIVGKALDEWLTRLLQGLEPWMFTS